MDNYVIGFKISNLKSQILPNYALNPNVGRGDDGLVQSSSLICFILERCFRLLETIIIFDETAVAPISKSKSSSGVPSFLNLDFSFA